MVDKSPGFINYIDLIDKIFPNSIHVNMVRNGLAVINSILFKYRFSKRKRDVIYRNRSSIFGSYNNETKFLFHKDLVEFVARQWLYLIDRGCYWKEILGERHLEVRYDELCDDPIKVFEVIQSRIGYDLGIDFSDVELISSDYKYKSSDWEADTFTKSRGFKDKEIKTLGIIKKRMEELSYDFDI